MASGARSAKLAAFFNDEDEDEAPSLPVKKDIEELKLVQFSHGINKKSKREKEKEAAEAKKLQEEQEAAVAYAEFVNAFDSDTTAADRSSAFVRAGERPNNTLRSTRLTSVFDDERRTPPPVASKPRGKRAMDTYLEQIKREQAEREARLKRQSQSQGKSVTSLAAMEALSGSRDRGDAETSNLFVANLPMHITEAAFGNFFSQHGPVGSVKIMWPRLDPAVSGPGTDINQARRNKSSGLSGFVSFLKRRDAEKALDALDGFDWGGSILRVGWSKAVPVASKAAYDARGATHNSSRDRDRSHERDRHERDWRDRRRSRSRSRPRSLSRSRSHKHESRYSRSRSPPRRRSRSRSRTPRKFHSRSRSRSRSPHRRSRTRSPRRSAHRSWRDKSRSTSQSRSPSRVEVDAETESFMRMVVGMIKDHGRPFEAALRERENGKPQFAFLWDENSPFYRTFRRLLESDQMAHQAFDDDGSISVYSTDSAEESEREHGARGRLGTLSRKRFEVMLRALTGKRGEIGRCMVFSLDHAEAASEIADIITSSLLVDSTAVPRKVARLFLICDILHNSAASVPFAWKFRQEFQGRLGLVFDHFSTIYHSFPGRITAETFKKQITSVIDVWEDWIVFPPDFTTELRSRLDGRKIDSDEELVEAQVVEETSVDVPAVPRFKASSFKPAADPSEAAPVAEVDGELLDDVDGEPMDDVDGEPINDVDGEPMSDIDGEPLSADIDGEPVSKHNLGESLDEDLDGAPFPYEEIDGAPFVGDPDSAQNTQGLVPPVAKNDDNESDNMSLDSDAGE